MTNRTFHAAIDLGAGSGRVFLGNARADAVQLREVHRFHYAPRRLEGRLRWDVSRLFEGLRVGLCRAADAVPHGGDLASVGVDSWGVDYGLIDANGALLEEPICYRDERTSGVMEEVFRQLPRETIFDATGIQLLPFNTIFQLAAHVRDGLPREAARLLMIPDLCHQFLAGSTTGERTNASTTQLLDIRTGVWSDVLFERLGLPRDLMPPIAETGSDLGLLCSQLAAGLGLPAMRVVAPATHDTASAVAGTPLRPGWAYISSGTWSLVGVERMAPLVDARARDANFTNESGVDGTYRVLKNVMGLWILESCRREWRAAGSDEPLRPLMTHVAARDGIGPLVYPDAPRFFNPASMLGEIRGALQDTGQQLPDDAAGVAKAILDSLACRYASVIDTLDALTGSAIEGVHIIGGGAMNEYLNQATANATGRPVLAGPVEATATGNLLVQAMACGSLTSIADGRRAVAASLPPRQFDPHDSRPWRDAAARYRELESAALATA